MTPLEAALQLAEEHSIPVFPCNADKKPLTQNGFHDATRNMEQVAEWWEKWPNALIGVPTGHVSGLLVVDVDPPGFNWYRQHHDKLVCACVHRTPRGGFHLLYKMPAEDIRCSAGQLAQGIDVRANGGYVIWWPACGHTTTNDDPGEVPAPLMDKLLKPAVPAVKVNGASIPEGGRNAALTSMAGRLRRGGADAHELRAALDAFNTSRCVPPLPAAEVERIATSVSRYPTAQVDRPPLTAVSLSGIMPHLSDSYVVKGVVARDSVVGIIGSSGSGKTFFAADLAAHIARGVPWRGQKVRAGLVVYVALEGLRSAENRFIAIREAVKPGNVALVLTGGPLNLRDPASVDALLTLVRSLESEFSTTCMAVFVDTLSRALAGGDENHSEDMASLVAGADTLRMATGAAIVLVHHLGKDAGRGARGHSLLNAALDTELTVSAQGGVHVATVTKQRDYAVGAGYAFKLEQVGVGLDEDGELVTTCLLKPESEVPPPAFTGKHQVAFDAALREWQREHTGEEFISDGEIGRLMLAQGLTRQRRADVLAKFTELHRLYPCEGGFRVR